MNSNERRSNFKNWAIRTVNNASTVDGYIKSLDNDFPNKVSSNSFFEITNIDALNVLRNRCGTSEDLNDWSMSIGRGRPMAAVGKYIDFLQEKNNQISANNLTDSGSSEQNEDTSKRIKNILLYGVPGVGKTHNINNLIGMIEKGSSDSTIFGAISENSDYRRNNLPEIKDRIEFVTFHQSFGYEDFIEGFRPNQAAKIELEDGVFKQLCRKARKNLEDSKKNIKQLQKEYSLKEKLEAFANTYQVTDEKIYLTREVYISNVDNNAFYYTSNSGGMADAKIPIHDLIECILNDVRELNDIRDLDNISGTSRNRPTYLFKLCEKFKVFMHDLDFPIERVDKVEKKNYYLIIDEINRGNISKIFGELITLIEEDKRDSYEVTLPYSKERFSIPDNLYIIGTMNSTDKSIALIDIALRRRFTFLKMEPNPELIKYLKAKELFVAFNEKIKEKLGKEYQIGHSYFMNIKNERDLSFVLEYKIKPLLEEYFYGDAEEYSEIEAIITGEQNDTKR